MIRVLIVDDSATVRLLIHAIIESDRDLVVAGEAANGEEAIRLCSYLQPDLVTMDIHMPGLSGYEVIQQIMAKNPRPIIVLTGIESQHLLDVSFRALSLGALNVLSKPAGMPGNDPEARNLIAQIKTLAPVKVIHHSYSPAYRNVPAVDHPARPTGTQGLPQIVAIGISTGGPPALQTVLNGLPTSFPLPVMVVQHISRGFVVGLASWLNDTTPFRCKVAVQGEIIQPGKIYMAPDDCHLLVKRNQVWLEKSKPVNGLQPSVDRLFESVASNYGGSAIGILMTGMGQDGASGLLAMYKAGGHTIAQDEASSIVFGMPKAAIDIGAAREVLGLDQIAPRLAILSAQKFSN